MKNHPLVQKLDQAFEAHTHKHSSQPTELYLSSAERKDWLKTFGKLQHRGVPIKSWDDFRAKNKNAH